MLKKNNSEIRFNTAGARILINKKLPNDFFVFREVRNIKRESTYVANSLEPIERDNIKRKMN
jgi:hypothetical protein